MNKMPNIVVAKHNYVIFCENKFTISVPNMNYLKEERYLLMLFEISIMKSQWKPTK